MRNCQHLDRNRGLRASISRSIARRLSGVALISGGLSTLLIGALAAPLAQAQPAQAGERRNTSALEEIVVTAQRRDENLQDVPVAVSALSTGDLQDAGVQNFADLQALTPALAISDGPGGRYLNIRGVGIGVGTPFQSAGVPLHIDGMYITRSEFFIREAYFDLEGVEVYRGPQGTFAGQNSTGGAIFVRSNQPNFDGFSGSIEQTVGDYEWFQTRGFLNLPISDVWAGRIAYNWERRDPFIEDRGRGGTGLGSVPAVDNTHQPGNINRRSLRGILRYKPSDALDVRMRYDFYNDQNDGDANVRTVPLTFNNPDAVPDPRHINYDFPTYGKVTVHRGIVNVQWQASDALMFKTVSGYQALESLAGADTDGTSPYVDYQPLTPGDQFAPQAYAATRIRNDAFFQEFDLLSTSGSSMQWVVGVVGLAEHTPLFNTSGNYNVDNCGAGCTTYDMLSGGSWLIYNQRHRSAAVFGEITYDFSDEMEFVLGGRYTYDKIELKRGSSARSAIPPNNPIPACGGGSLCDDLFGVGKFEEPTGRIGINWYPGGTRDTTVYLTLNRGFKPGGYQTALTLGSQPGPNGHPPYRSEILTAYESGLKKVFFDDHLRANFTGFYYDYEDWQASFRIPGQNIPRSQNMPKVEAYGGEIELQSAFNSLRLNANVSHTYSKVTKGPNQPLVIPANTFGPGSPAGTYSPVGLPLNYSPEWSWNASAEYDFGFDHGVLTPRLQYSHVDAQWIGLYHASQDFFPGHDVLDFRLAYKADQSWRVEGFVTNLTDELYVVGVASGPNTTPYINGMALGAPRQYGVRVQYDF